MELTKNDLLKLVTYFEGEIQARDIAIAALKVLVCEVSCIFYNTRFFSVGKVEASC